MAMTSTEQPRYNSKLANYPRPAIAVTLLLYAACASLEALPGTFLPPLLCFLALGVLALYLVPSILGLPNGRKSLREYCYDIRLLPMRPLGRNVLLGLLLATLTLGSILAASLLTGRFVLDWSYVPALRWVKGLTRGIWEEVFFRGIVLVLFMRLFSRRIAIFFSAFFFALVHLNPLTATLGKVVDVISIFFLGLLFTYVVLKTGSLLPAIVFHYVHDIFVLLVQNTPGADETLASALLFALLWIALVVGAVLTKYVVEHWPPNGSRPSAVEVQAC
jgi:membrane protease YdiL (CAAX protease family)